MNLKDLNDPAFSEKHAHFHYYLWQAASSSVYLRISIRQSIHHNHETMLNIGKMSVWQQQLLPRYAVLVIVCI